MQQITILSKSLKNGGGASKVAEMLAHLLQKDAEFDVEHWFVHGTPKESYQHCIHGLLPGNLDLRLSRRFWYLMGFPDFFTPTCTYFRFQASDRRGLLHFHDTLFSFSPLGMLSLVKRQPVLWTIHDCSAITGGCLYPLTCDHYTTRCHDCPPNIWGSRLLPFRSGWMQDQRRKLFQHPNLHVITPSQWMANEVQNTMGVPANRLSVIPNPIDTSIFIPRDKTQLRSKFGLKPDLPTIILAASSLDDPRKDVATALQCIAQLSFPHQVIAHGAGKNLSSLNPQTKHIYQPGYLSDENALAQCYAAADCLLFPTLADNLPNTIAESLCCGTPVVAANIGGIPEQIQDHTNGLLVPPKNPGAMAQALVNVLENQGKWWTPDSISQLAHSFYDPQRILSAHKKLYQSTVHP